MVAFRKAITSFALSREAVSLAPREGGGIRFHWLDVLPGSRDNAWSADSASQKPVHPRWR